MARSIRSRRLGLSRPFDSSGIGSTLALVYTDHATTPAKDSLKRVCLAAYTTPDSLPTLDSWLPTPGSPLTSGGISYAFSRIGSHRRQNNARLNGATASMYIGQGPMISSSDGFAGRRQRYM